MPGIAIRFCSWGEWRLSPDWSSQKIGMPDIQQLAENGLTTAASYLKALNIMIEGEILCEKEKVVAIKAGTEILRVIWDRTFPKLSSTKNTNVDVNMAKVLAILPVPLLEEVKRHLALPEGPKYVKSESEPSS